MALEPPEPHHHPHHGTGRAWLHMAVSLSAIFISAVSLYVAIHHGKIMEKLVSVNSAPYLDIMSGNAKPEANGVGFQTVSYVELRNLGVGPAHVKSIYITYEGRPIRSTNDLLKICCGDKALDLALNQSVEHFIPANESAPLWSARPGQTPSAEWQAFERLRQRLHIEACYCSVFDECYEVDTRRPGRREVKACVRDDTRHFVP